MVTYEPNVRLQKLAEKVIGTYDNLKHLNDVNCRIAYQTSSQAKKQGNRTVYADTERVKDKYKALMPYDFVITFYWPNCETLSEEKLEKLMYHELRHVGFAGEGNFSIIPHDVEDFHEILDKWGIDWL